MSTAASDPRPVVVESAAGAQVAGVRCEACGYAVATTRPRCPVCHGPVAPESFGPGGVVWSSTVVRVPVPGRTPPYALAYVDLDGGGPRVLAHTPGDAPATIGGRVLLGAKNADGDLVARPEAAS